MNVIFAFKTKAYTESLLEYDTILSAQTFRRIFQLRTVLSNNLQTREIDIKSL